MKLYRCRKELLIGVFLLVICFTLKAEKIKTVVLDADAAEISYSGRIDFTNPKRPTFCYSGVSIATVFQGTAIDAIIEDYATGEERNTNYYTVELDGKEHGTFAAMPGKHTYHLVKSTSPGKHLVRFFKRTECFVGKSAFCGFAAPAGTVFEKPEVPKYCIEFIGDSFTCGYGNGVSIPGPPEGNPNTGFHSQNENHYASYSAVVARRLNLSYRCVAYSGRGVYRNNNGNEEGTMPKIYTRIFPDDMDSPLWDVKKERPDVLVIKLGANDFFPESRGDDLNDSLFSICYADFLKQLRIYYPEAKIICLTGESMSDTWPEGRKCLTRIQQDVKAAIKMRNEAGDQGLYYFKLDQQTSPYGEDWHATEATHAKVAEQLLPFLKEITGW